MSGSSSSSSSIDSDDSSSSSSFTNAVVLDNEIVQLNTKLGGNPESYPFEKMDVLSPEVCQHLMTSTSTTLEVDSTTSASSSSTLTQQDITVDDLVEQIGLGTATELFDFFYESVGIIHDTTKFVIHRIYIVRQRSTSSSSTDPEEDNNTTIGYHVNDIDGNKWTLSVSLNDEYEGGELIYINNVQGNDASSPYQVQQFVGKAIVTPPRAVHGVAPIYGDGTQYTLIVEGRSQIDTTTTSTSIILDGTTLAAL